MPLCAKHGQVYGEGSVCAGCAKPEVIHVPAPTHAVVDGKDVPIVPDPTHPGGFIVEPGK